jgi:hypothetical protein
MGKKKTVETVREYENGELVNEVITETEEDVEEIKYVPIASMQQSSPKCSVCGADMVELIDNTGWWSVTPRPRNFQCSNPNCPSKQYLYATNTSSK